MPAGGAGDAASCQAAVVGADGACDGREHRDAACIAYGTGLGCVA